MAAVLTRPDPAALRAAVADADLRVLVMCLVHLTGELRPDKNFRTIWQAEAYSNFREQMLQQREDIDICKNCNQGLGLFI